VTQTQRKKLEIDIALALQTMEGLRIELHLPPKPKIFLRRDIKKTGAETSDVKGSQVRSKALATLPASERRASERIFSLIYECSPNRIVAKILGGQDSVKTLLKKLRTGCRSPESFGGRTKAQPRKKRNSFWAVPIDGVRCL